MKTGGRFASILFSLILISACNAPEARSPEPLANAAEFTTSATRAVSRLVRGEYSGDRAFETVAFLDQYVRWPGNRGFDASIDHVAKKLEEAGYVPEADAASDDRLTYRVESYPMDRPAWEPLGASVRIEGVDTPVLDFTSNRNMLATRSFSTPGRGVTAELVDAGNGTQDELDARDVRGRIVMANGDLSSLFRAAVLERGALGVLAYSMPDYLQPQNNKHSIQFRRIPYDESAKSWGIALSYRAHVQLYNALQKGAVRLHVSTKVRWTKDAVERTVVADVRGRSRPEERFVFSAHVQEPGANDNATGVGAQVEMARVTAALLKKGAIDPARSITFLWGDEIVSTRRYVTQDESRARGIRWGMSLDMVGEDTEKTGGTFLIEKMPDPSALWTRGEDHHTEWGSRPLTKKDMTPHYFNDIVLGRALEQAATNGWTVRTNPFEGGSDHVPFLNADIPSVLLWHFTDRFYHTDGDRLDKVSPEELKNSGVTALVTAFGLVSANGQTSRAFVDEVRAAAIARLEKESLLSQAAVSAGGNPEMERDILTTWGAWYDEALARMSDIEVGGASPETLSTIENARTTVSEKLSALLSELA